MMEKSCEGTTEKKLEEALFEILQLKKQLRCKDDEISYLRSLTSLLSNKSYFGEDHTDFADCSVQSNGERKSMPPTEGLQKSSLKEHNIDTVSDKLTNFDIARYSRQLILPELGVKGQLALRQCSMLVVGCGGLGCPAAIYLAASGVGCIGLLDYDVVETSNLHRQIMHTEARVGQNKAQSLAAACRNINSGVRLTTHEVALRSDNALLIINSYDVILDATDNIATRYLLSDACVIAKKPLVSGSALRFEGQLTVYNYRDSPCYRCLFPVPPSPETVTNCSDGGVLGAVVGVIGCLQAVECIKIVVGTGESLASRMVLYDGLDGTLRCVKLRGKQANCPVCSENPSITTLIDFEQFCGSSATDKIKDLKVISQDERITAEAYRDVLERHERHLLIDVRQPVELEICKLPTATINIPLEKMDDSKFMDDILRTIGNENIPVYFVCRRGNDSQLAVRKLKAMLLKRSTSTMSAACFPIIRDIQGGLYAWNKHVDPEFPLY